MLTAIDKSLKGYNDTQEPLCRENANMFVADSFQRRRASRRATSTLSTFGNLRFSCWATRKLCTTVDLAEPLQCQVEEEETTYGKEAVRDNTSRIRFEAGRPAWSTQVAMNRSAEFVF